MMKSKKKFYSFIGILILLLFIFSCNQSKLEGFENENLISESDSTNSGVESSSSSSSSSEQRETIILPGSNYNDVIIDHTNEVFKNWQRGGEGRNNPLLETKCQRQGGSASITREVCKDVNTNGVGRLHFETIKCDRREGDRYLGCITSDPCHIDKLESEPQYCKFDENNKIERVNQDGSEYQFKIDTSRTEGGGGIQSSYGNNNRFESYRDTVPIDERELPDLTIYDVRNDYSGSWAGVKTSDGNKPIHDNLANSFVDTNENWFPIGSLKAPPHPVMTYSLQHMKEWIQQEPDCARAEGKKLEECAMKADWAIPANMVGIDMK